MDKEEKIFPFPEGKKKGSGKTPPPPPPRPPAVFDDNAAKILQRTKITKSQFQKYVEQLSYYLLTHGAAEWTRSMVEGIARGDDRCMNRFEEIFGLVKKEGFVVNFNQNNLAVNTGNNGRDFDALLREIDKADREQAAIETTAETLSLPEGG